MRLLLLPINLLWLFVCFLWDLLVSSVMVARAVIAPRDITRPRLVTIPLIVQSPAGITMVANFISLTPGTLSIDVSPDRRTLLVHDLLAGLSSDNTRQSVRQGIETRVLRVTGR